MKRLKLLVLLCLSILSVLRAQILTNHPKYFPQGTTWVRSTENYGSQQLSFDVSRSTVKGTAVIDNKEYYVVEDSLAEPEDGILIREAEDKVYVYSRRLNKEILFYDFNWKEGQRIALFDYDEADYVLFSTDESTSVKLADGQTYQTIPLHGLVRTIGYVEGKGLFSLYPDVPDNGARMFISSFIRNGVEIIHHPVSIFNLAAPLNANPSAPSLFDLSGRRLSAPPAKGIYIRDSKKLMVK